MCQIRTQSLFYLLVREVGAVVPVVVVDDDNSIVVEEYRQEVCGDYPHQRKGEGWLVEEVLREISHDLWRPYDGCKVYG